MLEGDEDEVAIDTTEASGEVLLASYATSVSVQ